MTETTISLRWRLLASLTALSVVATVALVVGAWLYGRSAADRAYDRILRASALAIAEQLYVRDGTLRVDLPYASLDMLGFARDDRVFYRVVGPQGETLTGYGDLPPAPRSAEDGAVFFDAGYRGETVRFVVLGRLIAEPAVAGWARIQVGQTRRAREALAQDMAVSAAVPIVVLAAVLLALAWLVVTRGLVPLRRIGSELAWRDPDDLQPLAVRVPAEMAPMVDALNGFMARLARNLEQTRRFIADAAHQIRTPLAGLQAQAELARDEVDPERLAEALDGIAVRARETTRLTNQLLSNALVSHRGNLRALDRVDLGDIVRQAVQEATPLSGGRRGDVRVNLPNGELAIHGDAVVLREAVRNLVENALHHGPPQGVVTVDARADDGGWSCGVSDAGSGIPSDDRARVLERFERGSAVTAAGSGLGLAIAREAAELHGAELVMTHPPQGGFRVALVVGGER
ncbi:sensor histidine kinase [Arhodomonas sp. AD133]|uniref:sensor histidine kinase n=1 Tax=Arhodomonas sp. AD133 TaxID=3415009 RepID=UPI003EB81C97